MAPSIIIIILMFTARFNKDIHDESRTAACGPR